MLFGGNVVEFLCVTFNVYHFRYIKRRVNDISVNVLIILAVFE